MVMLVASCAFPSKKGGMTITDYESPKKIKDKILVRESIGGSITLPFWTSEISNGEFTAAVQDSLINSKLFTSLSNNWDDNWGLKIEIIKVDQPLIGIDFTVITNVKYTLYLKGKKVHETTVVADGTATPNDTVFAVKRLRLANEKSAKNNIQKFIKEISELDFAK